MRAKMYTPRRAGLARWLTGAPPWILDCIDSGPRAGADRFTIFLGASEMPRRGTYAESIVAYFGCSAHPCHPQGVGMHGEMPAHDAAIYRYRNRNRRIAYLDLPDDVRAFLESGPYGDSYADVTRIVRGESDPSQISGSVLEHGPDAARVTFANARGAAREAGEGGAPIIWPAQADAARSHFAGYGAWSREELAGYDLETLAAMLAQEAARDMREGGLPPDPSPHDWRAYHRAAREGRAPGRLHASRGRVWFYMGD